MKKEINELKTNQTHILVAIKYLNLQVEDMVEKTKSENTNEVKNIIESQVMIDEIMVKTCNDIIIIKKKKDENTAAIKNLKRLIDKMDKEIEITKKAYEGKKDTAKERLKPDISANLIECKMCVETIHRFVDQSHIRDMLETC